MVVSTPRYSNGSTPILHVLYLSLGAPLFLVTLANGYLVKEEEKTKCYI